MKKALPANHHEKKKLHHPEKRKEWQEFDRARNGGGRIRLNRIRNLNSSKRGKKRSQRSQAGDHLARQNRNYPAPQATIPVCIKELTRISLKAGGGGYIAEGGKNEA